MRKKYPNAKHGEWQRANAERTREYCRKWREANPEKVRLQSATKRARRLRATLQLTNEQEIALNNFYLECPKDMEVDHIVPLAGKTVCGLHVPWNLQYLTPFENNNKGNSFENW